jgi:hypothetical protein
MRRFNAGAALVYSARTLDAFHAAEGAAAGPSDEVRSGPRLPGGIVSIMLRRSRRESWSAPLKHSLR